MEKCGYITLTIEIKEADGQYASRCVELGTASCGATMEEAFENIKDAIDVHLNGLDEAGIVDTFLAERGIKVVDHIPDDSPREIPVSRGAFTRLLSAPVPVCP